MFEKEKRNVRRGFKNLRGLEKSLHKKNSVRMSVVDEIAMNLFKELKENLINSGSALKCETESEKTILLDNKAFTLEKYQNSMNKEWFKYVVNLPEDILEKADNRSEMRRKHNENHNFGEKIIKFTNFSLYQFQIPETDIILVCEYFEGDSVLLKNTQNEHVFYYYLGKSNLLVLTRFCIYVNGELSNHAMEVKRKPTSVQIIKEVSKQLINTEYITRTFSSNRTEFLQRNKRPYENYMNLFEKSQKMQYTNFPTFEEIEKLSEGSHKFDISSGLCLEVMIKDKSKKDHGNMYLCKARGYYYVRKVNLEIISLKDNTTNPLLTIEYEYYKNDLDLELSINEAIIVKEYDKEDR